ncbi:MAG: hypothetical protein VXZ72_01610 [Chlamydiota bacterium]|nr:hypothetical protein [Chlamydiota bacterium]
MQKENLSDLEQDLLSPAKKNEIISYAKQRIKDLKQDNDDRSSTLARGFESLEAIINQSQEA